MARKLASIRVRVEIEEDVLKEYYYGGKGDTIPDMLKTFGNVMEDFKGHDKVKSILIYFTDKEAYDEQAKQDKANPTNH